MVLKLDNGTWFLIIFWYSCLGPGTPDMLISQDDLLPWSKALANLTVPEAPQSLSPFWHGILYCNMNPLFYMHPTKSTEVLKKVRASNCPHLAFPPECPSDSRLEISIPCPVCPSVSCFPSPVTRLLSLQWHPVLFTSRYSSETPGKYNFLPFLMLTSF